LKKKYYFWGLGGLGKRIIKYIEPEIIKGIIDSDESKIGQKINGFTIQRYSKELIADDNIIIAFFNSGSVEKQLANDGVNFLHITEFFTEWYWNNTKENAIAFVDLPITLRCTLNCKHCMQYVPLHKRVEDILLKDIVKWWDNLLKLYPKIMEVSIIGGEPFLHPHLGDVIEHIATSTNVSVVITTNGTVQLNDDIISKLKKYEVFVSISDYSQTLPYLKSKVDHFQEKLLQHKISAERKTHLWIDQGRFDSEINATGRCARSHFQLFNNELWFCTLQCAAYKVQLCEAVHQVDYINLINEYSPIELYSFANDKEKTTSCNKCSSRVGKQIPVAEQV